MIHYQNDGDLIAGVQRNREDALMKLFEKYRPVVENNKRKYYLRDYDSEDLEQEALIICHQAAEKYDPEKGSFGSFYRTQLNNNSISLLRKKHAARRVGDEKSLSLEHLQESKSSAVEEALGKEVINFLHTSICDEYLTSLSETELIAFQVVIGKYTFQEALNKYDLNEATLKRAKSRANRKFSELLMHE